MASTLPEALQRQLRLDLSHLTQKRDDDANAKNVQRRRQRHQRTQSYTLSSEGPRSTASAAQASSTLVSTQAYAAHSNPRANYNSVPPVTDEDTYYGRLNQAGASLDRLGNLSTLASNSDANINSTGSIGSTESTASTGITNPGDAGVVPASLKASISGSLKALTDSGQSLTTGSTKALTSYADGELSVRKYYDHLRASFVQVSGVAAHEASLAAIETTLRELSFQPGMWLEPSSNKLYLFVAGGPAEKMRLLARQYLALTLHDTTHTHTNTRPHTTAATHTNTLTQRNTYASRSSGEKVQGESMRNGDRAPRYRKPEHRVYRPLVVLSDVRADDDLFQELLMAKLNKLYTSDTLKDGKMVTGTRIALSPQDVPLPLTNASLSDARLLNDKGSISPMPASALVFRLLYALVNQIAAFVKTSIGKPAIAGRSTNNKR